MAQQRKALQTGGDVVTVACKLPHGLILRVFRMVKTQEPVMGGGYRDTQVAQELPERVVLNGWSHPQIAAPKCELMGGFALTPGVSREFWELWLEQNKDSDMVRNGLVFANSNLESVRDEAEEKAKEKSGLERLDPDHLPKGIQKSDLMKQAA